MLTLLMLRHAKSDWSSDYGGNDVDRPLAPRGRRSAKAVGRFITAAGQVPDLILVSPALRARETVELARASGSWGSEVKVDQGLYGDAAGLVEAVRGIKDSVRLAMIVGHEPAWSGGASRLTNGTEFRLPTASVLRLDFEVDTWAGARGNGRVMWLVTPRLIVAMSQEGRRARA